MTGGRSFVAAWLVLLVAPAASGHAATPFGNGPVTWVQTTFPADPNAPPRSSIEVLRRGTATPLLRRRSLPAFSADGRWLLSQDDSATGCRLWLNRPGTGRQRVLREDCRAGFSYDWSPRGDAFVLYRQTGEDESKWTTSVVHARTGVTVPLGQVDTKWSPSGRRLLVGDASGARVLDLGSGRSSRMCGNGDLSNDDWSPAGWLVLVRGARTTAVCSRTGRLVSRLPQLDYTWAQARGRLTRTYSAHGHDAFAVVDLRGHVRWRVADASIPTWTPSGKVAYERGGTTVWTADVNGRHRHRVGRIPSVPASSEGSGYSDELRWSPDGRELVALRTVGDEFTSTTSFVASAAGRGWHEPPANFVTYSPDGRRMILSGGYPQDPSDLWVADAKGRHARRVRGVRGADGVTQLEDIQWPPAPVSPPSR